MEMVKVEQEEGDGLESNVLVFIKDFWRYESGNNFSQLMGKK